MSPVARRVVEVGIGLAVLIAAVSALSGGCGERVEPGVVAVQGIAAAGQPVAVEDETETAVEWASGQVASARQTAVASRVLARIEDVRVRAGSPVAEGDVLVVLDARDLGARLGETEEALRAAQARLELAQSDYARVQELFGSGVVPQQRLDQASSALRAATAEVAARAEAREQARAGRSFAEIRSPVTGRVVDRLAEPGDTAVPGQPLMRIYDPSLLRVEVPVRESLAVALAVGDVLRVEVPALDETLEGPIDELVPFAEPGARTLLVKVRLPRTDGRLFAGMFARVAIPAGVRRRIVVPERAVQRVGQLESVLVVSESGEVERRMVTTGQRAGAARVEVLSGLTPGERVLVADAEPPAEGGGEGSRP